MAQRNSLALLIDSDNVSSKYIGAILGELSSRHGRVTYRRIYGDWTSPQMGGWKEVLAEHSLTPMQQFPNTVGKNATDSFMIIDAMDILHEGRVGGFCIVSSDGDFTRLASRLRDAGMEVVGMGERKTPASFRNACTAFTYLETLLGADSDEADPDVAGASKDQRDKMRAAIADSVIDLINEGSGSARLSEVGARLVGIYPDFDVRSFGYSQLSTFLESYENLSVTRDGGSSSVRLSDRTRKRYENVAQFVRDKLQTAGGEGVALSTLGSEIRERYRSFNMKEFGYAKFSAFVRGIDGVEVDVSAGRAWRA